MWTLPPQLEAVLPDPVIPVLVVNQGPIWDDMLCPVWKNAVNAAGLMIAPLGTDWHAICYVTDWNTDVSIPVSQLAVPTDAEKKIRGNMLAWELGREDDRRPRSEDRDPPKKGDRKRSTDSSYDPLGSSVSSESSDPSESVESTASSSGERSETPVPGRRARERSLTRDPNRDVSISRHRRQLPPTAEEVDKDVRQLFQRIVTNPNKPSKATNWFPNEQVAAREFLKYWHKSQPVAQEVDADKSQVSLVRLIEYVWDEMRKNRLHRQRGQIAFIKRVFSTYQRGFLKNVSDRRAPNVRRWRTETASFLARKLHHQNNIELLRSELRSGKTYSSIKYTIASFLRHHHRATQDELVRRFLRVYDSIKAKGNHMGNDERKSAIETIMERMGLTRTRTASSFNDQLWREMKDAFDPSRSRSGEEEEEEEKMSRPRPSRARRSRSRETVDVPVPVVRPKPKSKKRRKRKKSRSPKG
jgi:hypothetical protein